MSGIDDVARRAGVSTATVSRALRGRSGVSEATRLRVTRVAESMGYVASSAAAGLATGRAMALGVLVPVIGRWFFANTIEGVDQHLRQRGYDLSVYGLGGHGTNRERVFNRTMLRKRIDGLIVLCMTLTEAEREALMDLDIPVVVVGGPLDGCRHVSIDNRAAAREATNHLIELGHKRILHLAAGGSFGIDFAVPALRGEGFEEALRDAGLPPGGAGVLLGDYRAEASRDVVAKLLADPDVENPTAIFASFDEMAFGAMTAIRQAGLRIPDDISVIGIDDHELAATTGLTTIRQFPREQGRIGAELILSDIDAGRPSKASIGSDSGGTVIPHELVIRSTTAPPRA